MSRKPWSGVGDLIDPVAGFPVPGSIRQVPPQPINQLPPEQAAATEAQVQAFLAALERMRLNGRGLPTEPVSYTVAQVNSYVLGAAASIRVDDPVRRERRCVVLTNTSVAAAIWYGYDSSVRVNLGGYLPAGLSVSLPINERVNLYAVSAAAGTIISVHQFGS